MFACVFIIAYLSFSNDNIICVNCSLIIKGTVFRSIPSTAAQPWSILIIIREDVRIVFDEVHMSID